MRHILNSKPEEETPIPPEIRVEVMASKPRVKARINEIVSRIREQEESRRTAETPGEMVEETAVSTDEGTQTLPTLD